MAKTAPKPKMPSLDELLFTTQEERDDMQRERVVDILLDEIDSFPDHPFQVRIDDEMRELVENIKEYGVLTPAIARQKEDGRYELVSGHRRKMASELAGLKTLPTIVREMDSDAAIVFMVNANMQRRYVLPSEKAKAFRMKLEVMNRQGERVDLTCSPVENKLQGKKSIEIIGEEAGESKNQIHRYIRLTELIPKILRMVDEAKIAFRPAVELSYLAEEEQRDLLDKMDLEQATPSLAQAIKLKQFSQEGRLNGNVILSIMREQKPNQVDKIKIPRDKLSRYFDKGTPVAKIEEIIIKALELYRKRERNKGRER
ncbi:MAG: ParB/RepB/Spo0J family partition protein [Coriobacteriales bacterium]|jgi:ParB family chromosome partitioning protein|nr:ParB/RepB/Spo0J family partition protein [Coriobacteriales bacterium]